MDEHPMTGRDLIVYILTNGLENEPIVKDGSFIGFMTVEKYAVEKEVGVETVLAWIKLNTIKSVEVGNTTYILA